MDRLKPLIVLMALAGTVCFAQPVRGAADVDRAAVKVERKTFDPRRPPAEMPKLQGPEAAVTVSTFGIEASMRSQVMDEEKRGSAVVARVKVTEVKVRTSLDVVIWLPTDADKRLEEHEEGHRIISERFYEDAQAVARQLAEELDGKVLRGAGRDAEAASRAAMDKAIHELTASYMKQTKERSSRVQDLFDEITDHSRNTKLSVNAGIDRAFERWREEQKGQKRR